MLRLPRVCCVLLSALAGLATATDATAQRRQPGPSQTLSQGSTLDLSGPKPGEVVAYDLAAVTQTFLASPTGGVERVVANETGDATQIGIIRVALQKLADSVSSGDYSVPLPAFRGDPPGLAAIIAARPGEVRAAFVEIRAGAEVRFSCARPELVEALHQWFAAQQAHGPGTPRR